MTNHQTTHNSFPPAFQKQYRQSEETLIPELLNKIENDIAFTPEELQHIHDKAANLIQKVRKNDIKALSVENFLQTYDLGSQEGIALLCLAEAYLRIPDPQTQNAIIRDKISSVEWSENTGKTDSFVMKLATLGLSATDSLMTWGLNREGLLGKLSSLSRKFTEPMIREAIHQAMKLMGQQFVLGESIQSAIEKAQGAERMGYVHSYDMLGEGAKTKEDAQRYYKSYEQALQTLAAPKYTTTHINKPIYRRPGLSIKLTALHPRFELSQKTRVFDELFPLVHQLCRQAKDAGIPITIDAEESERLELTLEILEKLCQQSDLNDWDGLGIAVQAYQKRAISVIDWLSVKAQQYQRRFAVRLVKGAYWDTEIKKAQELGLSDYPVFTRKAHTDLSYLLCAHKMLLDPLGIYPQFATHNAYTVATILELAHRSDMTTPPELEFQRLHGMGEQLYAQIVSKDLSCRIYAPVGQHQDLLAYLVRRLLENGANSSFVNKIYDREVKIESLLTTPISLVKETVGQYHHPNIPLPRDILDSQRLTAKGIDLSDQNTITHLEKVMVDFQNNLPLHINRTPDNKERGAITICDPADPKRIVSTTNLSKEKDMHHAMNKAEKAFESWTQRTTDNRASLLEKWADLLEHHTEKLMALLVHEGGKTFDDAISEVREAIDFCRYYTDQARLQMGTPLILPGPTGEDNELSLHGRGIFACISPWNFPLAIFVGQISAALVTGNCVLAKPAQQTPATAHFAVELAHKAGIPTSVLQLILAKGNLFGKTVLQDPRIAGVAFTGSTDVAWTINKILASRHSAIGPLIAETGGINAMIVDSSALPEQAVGDIITSAFQSAGQRCSALRLLFIQEDIANKTLEMLKGAMAELSIGHPSSFSTDIGPVINTKAQTDLLSYVDSIRSTATLLAEVPCSFTGKGAFVPPQAWILPQANLLTQEIFGPILHIVRYQGDQLPTIIDHLNKIGFGLTLGLHSRIDETIEMVRKKARVGNFYVNRSMIGAVVGVQPFGGEGFSGTGPKAGGPHYLQRFTIERTYTRDTTAAGGNASLLANI